MVLVADGGAADEPDQQSKRYLPIAEHGLIGDLRTAALVGADGRIDWFCYPRFDSASVFGAVLDADDGGHWTIAPTGSVANARQFYIPDSNVLITRFLADDGLVELRDFMPLARAHDPEHHTRIVRIVTCVRGRMRLRSTVAPRFDYGRAGHEVTVDGDRVCLRSDDLELHLRSEVPASVVDDRDVVGEFALQQGDTVTFVLSCEDEAGQADAEGMLRATVRFWQDWISGSVYTGRWREMVNRSALTLKMLTHEPSGAIVAAPTVGLPESVGGDRNWDYRYVWIRDASFSLYALLRLGFTEEAAAFMHWLTQRFEEQPEDSDGGPLRIMYDIDGGTPSTETELGHWQGYRGSRPVRIGNAAEDQLQLDIYGELIDSVYLFNKYGAGISYRSWQQLRRVVSWLQDNWDRPDQSIWETRAEPQKHVYSRLMCWVAMERMTRIARSRGLPGDIVTWSRVRDEIFEQVMQCGWSDERSAFVQTYDDRSDGENELDASLLLMASVKFLSPTDEKVRRHAGRDRAVAGHRLPGVPLRRRRHDRRPRQLRGHLLDVLVLARGGTDADGPAGRGAAGAGEDVHLRQPPRTVRRAGRAERGPARQLPAGAHAPVPDQRRDQPGPGARPVSRRPVAGGTGCCSYWSLSSPLSSDGM